MIECRDIYKVYRDGDIETKALAGISFKVDDGEFVAIMGPSGSGKSTLMHILGRLDVPTSGKYFLDNEDVSDISDDKLAEIRNKKIGFVFQSYNLLPRTSVLQNVTLPLIYAGVSAKEREKIAKTALKDSAFPEAFWNYQPNQISGGMAQRVAIARALVNNPALILADEPTGNLDTKTGEAVLETFQKLNFEKKKTIVLITHERYVAEHAARILHIQDGKLINDEINRDRKIIVLNKNENQRFI